MVSPQKSRLVFLRHPGHSRAAISSADATRGHGVTLKYFPLLEKGEISPEKQWQSLRWRAMRNSASGNTEGQQLNSPKGHAQPLYPAGDRLGRKFFFRGPLTQLSSTTQRPSQHLWERADHGPGRGAPRLRAQQARVSVCEDEAACARKTRHSCSLQPPSPRPPPPPAWPAAQLQRWSPWGFCRCILLNTTPQDISSCKVGAQELALRAQEQASPQQRASQRQSLA